jgi:hypothetical protein
MSVATPVVWAHVLSVFWLVGGILARDRCYALARSTDDLSRLQWLVEMGGHFERRMARPATFAVLLAGLMAAWARGWPILGLLQGSPTNWVLVSLLVYLTIIPVIAFIFIPRGRIFRAAFEEATSLGQVTPALKAALSDRMVVAARAYELIMIGVITAIMLTRSF